MAKNCQDPAVDPELFFAPTSEGEFDDQNWGEQELRAQFVCIGCEFQPECLTLGMDEEDGVWGGHTQAERAKLRAGEPIRITAVPVRSPGRDLVVSRFKDGLSIDQIADELGLVRTTVHRRLKEHVTIQGQPMALATRAA